MRGRMLALLCALAGVAWRVPARGAEEPPPVVEGIRAEATRGNADPVGRPLPLAANWNVRYWEPAYQVEMVRQGHHVLPWVGHPQTSAEVSEEYLRRYLERNAAALRLWAAWKMPLTIRDHNYAMALARKPYSTLPPERNPNTVRPDGSILKRPSPLGPIEPWREVGRALTANPMMRKLQELYPDPPLVQFLSNNETRKLRWHELGDSARYVEKHGEGREGDFKRELVAQGWTERFRALLGAMREGLVSEAWRRNARFVGYDAFGPACLGRWGGWGAYAIATAERIDPHPLYWDGGSPSFYDNDWEPHKADYRVWSPQVEAMNWPFMIEEAHRLNPDFWFEISVWDGNQDNWARSRTPNPKSKPNQYRARGESWTPARYAGRVQFGLWLVHPRAVREFRSSTQTREQYQAFWDAVVEAVDRVWREPELTRFWRRGRLVANRAHRHPWQAAIPEKYRAADRWFLLDTSLDAPWPWKNDTTIPVFAIAHVLGEKPRREWLLYAHAPLGARQGVRVTVPDYGPVTMDVAVGGSFVVVQEAGGKVAPVVFRPE